jgi:hypothetical protein
VGAPGEGPYERRLTPRRRAEEVRRDGRADEVRADRTRRRHVLQYTLRPRSSTSAVARTFLPPRNQGVQRSPSRRVLARRRHSHQMQRIYGTAFFTRKELRPTFIRLRRPKARSRARRELDLFSIRNWRPGLAFFTPKAESSATHRGLDARPVCRPRIFARLPPCGGAGLWKTSGHYNTPRAMFARMELDDAEYSSGP